MPCTLPFFHFQFLDLRDPRSEAADRFITDAFRWSGARGKVDAHAQPEVEFLASSKLDLEFLCDGAATVEKGIPAFVLVTLVERAHPEDVAEAIEEARLYVTKPFSCRTRLYHVS